MTWNKATPSNNSWYHKIVVSYQVISIMLDYNRLYKIKKIASPFTPNYEFTREVLPQKSLGYQVQTPVLQIRSKKVGIQSFQSLEDRIRIENAIHELNPFTPNLICRTSLPWSSGHPDPGKKKLGIRTKKVRIQSGTCLITRILVAPGFRLKIPLIN